MAMRALKHLPLDQWPPQDHAAFEAAYADGDIFDDSRGPGAHLSHATRWGIRTGWRRWLGALTKSDPEALSLPPAERITPERVRAFVEHLRGDGMRAFSIAIVLAQLYDAARIIAPTSDWQWLRALVTRLEARAQSQDRFDRLVPPWETLDCGIELMDAALAMSRNRRRAKEIQYRDGLIMALLSCWPIRRRGLASLTISRHLRRDRNGIELQLLPEDTKEKRAECWRVPDELVPYLEHYLLEIRPAFPGTLDHDGLWGSCKGGPLLGNEIYVAMRRRTAARFGKAMGLHDFRRAAATFLAIDAPEKVGLIPGVLQHKSPDTGERYKHARAIQASRRAGATLSALRARLRPLLGPNRD